MLNNINKIFNILTEKFSKFPLENSPFITYHGTGLYSLDDILSDGIIVNVQQNRVIQGLNGVYMGNLNIALGYAFGLHCGGSLDYLNEGVIFKILISDYSRLRLDEDLYNDILKCPKMKYMFLTKDEISFVDSIDRKNVDDWGFSLNKDIKKQQLKILKRLQQYTRDIIVSNWKITWTGKNKILDL